MLAQGPQAPWRASFRANNVQERDRNVDLGQQAGRESAMTLGTFGGESLYPLARSVSRVDAGQSQSKDRRGAGRRSDAARACHRFGQARGEKAPAGSLLLLRSG